MLNAKVHFMECVNRGREHAILVFVRNTIDSGEGVIVIYAACTLSSSTLLYSMLLASGKHYHHMARQRLGQWECARHESHGVELLPITSFSCVTCTVSSILVGLWELLGAFPPYFVDCKLKRMCKDFGLEHWEE